MFCLIPLPSYTHTHLHSQSIMLQIIRGIEHIHAHLVLHRDLKPENVLVNREVLTPPAPRAASAGAAEACPTGEMGSGSDSGSRDAAVIVKITDFGLARQYLPPQQEYTGKVSHLHHGNPWACLQVEWWREEIKHPPASRVGGTAG